MFPLSIQFVLTNVSFLIYLTLSLSFPSSFVFNNFTFQFTDVNESIAAELCLIRFSFTLKQRHQHDAINAHSKWIIFADAIWFEKVCQKWHTLCQELLIFSIEWWKEIKCYSFRDVFIPLCPASLCFSFLSLILRSSLQSLAKLLDHQIILSKVLVFKKEKKQYLLFIRKK